MTNASLAQSYLVKATTRLKILTVLLEEDAFSDVIREAQKIVELALKAIEDARFAVAMATKVIPLQP